MITWDCILCSKWTNGVYAECQWRVIAQHSSRVIDLTVDTASGSPFISPYNLKKTTTIILQQTLQFKIKFNLI